MLIKEPAPHACQLKIRRQLTHAICNSCMSEQITQQILHVRLLSADTVQWSKVPSQLLFCSYSAVLLKRFLDSQSEQPDPYQHMALVLTNLTRQRPGRQLLLERGKGTFGALASQLRAPSALRRKGCANAIRNCCFCAEVCSF